MSSSEPQVALYTLVTGVSITYAAYNPERGWEALLAWVTLTSFAMSLSAHITASRVQAMVESRGY